MIFITWQWHDEEEVHECRWSEFLADNGECLPDDPAVILAGLRRTGEFIIGGGASPTMILRYSGFETRTA